jgi:hypothetical protein
MPRKKAEEKPLIPVMMLGFLKVNPLFKELDDDEILAKLATMPLREIASIKGVGQAYCADYAIDTGRHEELLETGWRLSGMDYSIIKQEYIEKQLLTSYEPETWNDRDNIKQLAALYVLREQLTNDLINMSSDDEIGGAGPVSRQLSSINDSIVKMEEHLEIDPATRSARAQKATTSDTIQELVDTAADFMADNGVIHHTDHGSVGYTVWMIQALRYMPRCAKCGEQHFVFRSPWDENDYPFMVATEDQIANYVFASDFRPKGAPSGIGVFDKPEDLAR